MSVIPQNGKGTAPKTKEEILAALQAINATVDAEVFRAQTTKEKIELKAAIQSANADHWLTLDLPEVNTLFKLFPDLLPYPEDSKEQTRILLGIAWSARKDSEVVLLIYADRLEEKYPEGDVESRAPLRTMDEWIDALSHNALLFKVKPYNIDELLMAIATRCPDFDLPLYRQRFRYYDKKKQETAEKKEDKGEFILSLMELGKPYASSFFIPAHMERSEFRKVMGDLVSSKRVEKIGELKSTRYLRMDGVMRSVETPPPSDVFKGKK